jgi:integrase
MSASETGEPGRPRESFDVRFWAIRSYRGKRKQTHSVRWTVAGQEHHDTFETRPLAVNRLAELRTYARNGAAFDVDTGVPVPQLREAQAKAAAEAARASLVTWHEHTMRYFARRRDSLAGNSLRSAAESLATIGPILLMPGRGRPEDSLIREALYQWAYRERPETPPANITATLEWIAAHSRPLAELADQDLMLDVLDAISRKLDGTRAAPNTIARKRAALSNVLEFGVGRGLDVNPLPQAVKVWNPPETTDSVVDPQVVVNRQQAEQLLIAVSYQSSPGPLLVSFFACLYYAGLRPGEAVELRESSLDLPADRGWGTLYLRGSAPCVGAGWSQSGRRRDRRQLKHRAEGEVRPVPCHPALTRHLLRHLAEFGTAPDGRLFRGVRGGDLSESVYGRAWQSARLLALTPAAAASPLAGRPYDLRHACLSTWLNSGVDPAQVAEWAGNSVAVLLRTYVKCIAGRDAINRRRIEDALRDDDLDQDDPHEKPNPDVGL